MSQKPEEVEIKELSEHLMWNMQGQVAYETVAKKLIELGYRRTPTPSNEDGRKLRVLDEKKVISIALFVLLNHTYLSKVSNKECVDLSLKIGKEISLRLGSSPIPTIEDIYNTIGLTYLKGCSEDGSYLNDTHVQLNYKDKFRLAQAIHSLLKGEA